MSRRKTTFEFIEQATLIHCVKYTYENVNYINNSTKVAITCPSHGSFMQSPIGHINMRQGCPVCSGNQRLDTERFIERATEVHSGVYDYSLVDYISSHVKIIITCGIHGCFKQTPDNHLRGNGCPNCSSNQRSDTNSFVEKARVVHGGMYDYSKTLYVDNVIKVDILCGLHGVFNQRPGGHLSGKGCPSCAASGFDKTKCGHLYVLVSACSLMMKIGITGDTNQRFKKLTRVTPFSFDVLEVFGVDGTCARAVERELHNLGTPLNLEGFDGCTEWFKYDGDVLDVVRTIFR